MRPGYYRFTQDHINTLPQEQKDLFKGVNLPIDIRIKVDKGTVVEFRQTDLLDAGCDRQAVYSLSSLYSSPFVDKSLTDQEAWRKGRKSVILSAEGL